ncbi:MAG TPA: Uma2 family endonuclease, partial [Pirellulales bacterium]|nr:Uma2 family endonuclease [Pirellulales bacterium]
MEALRACGPYGGLVHKRRLESQMATSQIVTADELLQMPSGDNRYELVRGELHAMSPTGHPHGIVTAALTIRLGSFVRQHKL